jgi:hypothetical protein
MNEGPHGLMEQENRSDVGLALCRVPKAVIPADHLQGVPSGRVCVTCGGSVVWSGDARQMECVLCGGDDYRMRDAVTVSHVERMPLQENPAWETFGFRGQVAKLLWQRGLKTKAVRFANCNCLGRPGVCKRYPFEHKFFVPHGCSVIFCRDCATTLRKKLFVCYLQVIRNAMLDFAGEREQFDCLAAIFSDKEAEPKHRKEAETALHDLWYRVARRVREEGWVLARINLTLCSDGSEITPDRVKKMNAAVRSTMRKSIGKARGFGMLFVDEVGFETRGHIRERKARGLNPHAHGLYFGPRLDWEKTRDLWMRETTKRFGVPSRGFWISKTRGIESDPERTIRHALNHMLKYVSKPPAVTPDRLASLIAAFNGARRVHSLGLFYGKKPKHKKRDCPCPKCRAAGIDSSISFEGSALPSGGCIPRLVSVEDLRKQGYLPLCEDGRTTNFGDVPLERMGSGSP